MLEPMNYIPATQIFSDELVKTQSEAMWNVMGEEVKQAYGGESGYKRSVETMLKYSKTGRKEVFSVVETYTNALFDVFPQVRYQPMDLRSKIRNFINAHLPEVVYDRIYVP